MKTILVIGKIRQSGMDLLQARRDIETLCVEDTFSEDLNKVMPFVHGIVVRTNTLTPEVLELAPELKVISRHGVGYDNVPLDYCNKRSIAIALATTSNRASVAEFAFFMMLELNKHGRKLDQYVRSGNWQKRLTIPLREINGQELLLIGCGRIGAELAKRARVFGLKLRIVDPYLDKTAAALMGAEMVEDLDQALTTADIVSLHLPLNGSTRNTIDERRLTLMKNSAILINTARGGLVDEKALYHALKNGEIRAAGIDVFEEEPPAAANSLFELEQCYVSPHIAGITQESMDRMAFEAARNALSVLDGQIDPEIIVNSARLRGV